MCPVSCIHKVYNMSCVCMHISPVFSLLCVCVHVLSIRMQSYILCAVDIVLHLLSSCPFPGRDSPDINYWSRTSSALIRNTGKSWMVGVLYYMFACEDIIHMMIISDSDKEEAQKIETALTCIKVLCKCICVCLSVFRHNIMAMLRLCV